MKTKMMGLILFLGLMLGFGMGCQSMAPKNYGQSLQLVDKIADIAERHGVSWNADVSFDGNPGVYQNLGTGLHTGISLSAHIQGNAQSETGQGPMAAIKPEDDPMLDPNASPSPGGR